MEPSESKLPGVRSSRSYVEHLRTIHFALIAAAAGLMALVLTARSYDARRALTQVQEILELKKQWSTDWVSASIPLQPEARVVRPGGGMTLVETYGDSRTKRQQSNSTNKKEDSSTNKEQASVAQENKDCPASGSSSGVARLPFSEIVYVKIPATGDPREDATVVELHLSRAWSPNPEWQERNEFSSQFPASNLREMKAWWDGLINARSGAIVHELLEDCVVFDYSTLEPVSCKLLTHFVHSKLYPYHDWASLGRVDYKVTANAYFEGPPAENCDYYNARRGAYWFTGWYSDHLVRVYATYSIITIDQSVIARKLGESAGSFEKRFADLAEAGRGLEALPLEKIEDRLSEEVSKGGDTFEALGLKLPGEQVTNWGAVLLICAQLYLTVCLRQLWGRLREDDDGWAVPWIGLDSSWLGQWIFAVSLLLAPLSVTLLRYHALRSVSRPSWFDWVGFLTTILLSAGLAIRCWFCRPLLIVASAKQPTAEVSDQ
jgi:hypothetical protein